MEHRCDVLVMIFGMIGRDTHALIPIIYTLKNKFNLNVKIRSIFDFTAIDRLYPKVLLTNGCTGSGVTYKVTKYASKRGIHTVSLHAEGMFRKKNLESAIIGWNKDKKPSVKKWYLWNKNSYRWAIEKYPHYETVLDIAGSTLHEKYKIFEEEDFNKNKFLKGKFDSIIFYAGWTFDKAIKNYRENKDIDDPEINKKFVVKCLKTIAENFPETLLILKYHPSTFDESLTEISNYYDSFENVMIVHDEYPIYELIFVSDITINFDSTTCIDSWLANKTTFSLYKGKNRIYPDGSFGYEDLRKGSIVPNSPEELIEYINEYFKEGKIKEYERKKKIREKKIKEYIGNINKKPSLKIAEYISSVIESNRETKPIINEEILINLNGLIQKIFYKIKFLPNIPIFTNMRENYKKEKFMEQYNMFKPKLKRYFGF